MTNMTNKTPQSHEAEFYAEPAPMSGRDTAGVVLALMALLLIGAGGYVWLTPGLTLAGLLGGARVARPPVPSATEVAAEQPHAGENALRSTTGGSGAPMPAGSDLIAVANADRAATCPQCGMSAGASDCEVTAQFSDGSTAHFDSWVCAFGWAKDKGLVLNDAVVMAHGSTRQAPQWLSAASAAYLYDTKRITGSMPPYVAAFTDKPAAEAAQARNGGEIQDWEGLQTKFK